MKHLIMSSCGFFSDWFDDDNHIMVIGRKLPVKEHLFIGCHLGLKIKEIELIYQQHQSNLGNVMPYILMQWREMRRGILTIEEKMEEILSVLRDLNLNDTAEKIEVMYKENKKLRHKDIDI